MQSCGKTANQVENNVFEELGIYKSGRGTVCERLCCLWGKGKSKDVGWAELSVIGNRQPHPNVDWALKKR